MLGCGEEILGKKIQSFFGKESQIPYARFRG